MTQLIKQPNYADCSKCHINIYKCGCDKFIGGDSSNNQDQKKEIFDVKAHLYPVDQNITPFPDEDMVHTDSHKDMSGGGDDNDYLSKYAGKSIYQVFYQIAKSDYKHLKSLN